MNIIAIIVIAAWVAVSVWAWMRAPGQQAADQFRGVWKIPWGKQFYVDFFGLQIVLALWMLTDAAAHDTMIRAVVCLVTMPVLGAFAAAAYWLLRSL